MADLIVPAGSVLAIDASFAIAPKYDVLRMEANSIIRTAVDLILNAERAEFANNCLIDARGTVGPAGANGPVGLPGGKGWAGQRGSHITIRAALAEVGGLKVITDGGAGGSGGMGGMGLNESTPGSGAGAGGQGGQGGPGSPAGQIHMSWVRAAPGLPNERDVAPVGHTYQSNGGAGGNGGPGGHGGLRLFGGGGPGGPQGAAGPVGESRTPRVEWQADLTSMLWAQAQDIGPSPRRGHAVAYDTARGKLVLFGGQDGANRFGDTWEWDGAFWTQVADTGPAARAFAGMAFDDSIQRIVLFGGSIADPSPDDQQADLMDTWAWDGNAWIQLEDTGPAARQATAMASDPVRKKIVLFGGGQLDRGGRIVRADTWEWDGAAWTEVADTGPAARLGSRMAYDSEAASLLLFGGAAEELLSDSWAWDGQHWKQVADTGPSARMGHTMASLEQGIILFGGVRQVGAAEIPLNDTWAWTAGAWRQIQDIGAPPRYDHGMATVLNSGSETVTLVGGHGAATYSDTWQLRERTA